MSLKEREDLKQSFDKISEDNLINKHMFRIEVLGAQVPDVIAERIFCAFATCISKQKQENMRKGVVKQTEEEGGDAGNITMDISVDGMCFEDIMACYIVFKTYKENEIS